MQEAILDLECTYSVDSLLHVLKSCINHPLTMVFSHVNLLAEGLAGVVQLLYPFHRPSLMKLEDKVHRANNVLQMVLNALEL